MKRKDIISITGDLGSGQSTVCKMISEKYGYYLYKNGELFRKMAVEYNMSVTEFGEYIENHPDVDRQMEKAATDFAKTNSNIVIDAKMGWYAVPESYKVYLKVDIDVAAKRAFLDENRKRSEDLPTIQAQKEDMLRRSKNDLERYYKLYNVRRDDMSNYDLVIDTSKLTPDDVFNKIQENYEKWKLS